MTTPITQGVHHVGLTVPDLSAAEMFFINTLSFEKVAEKPDYPAVFVSDGNILLTLWQAYDPHTATPFDRKNVIGLHHLALKVENHESLDALHRHLTQDGAASIEFAPEPLGQGTVRHMMTVIPGGIRIEFLSISA
ncbi:MAG: VOC family protein [Pseudomonadales bacterium]